MDRNQEKHYEELFNRLLDRGEALHTVNKKRIRIGLIFLAVFTVGMIVIRLITDSDRATFLMIWVIGMFATSIYLIGVEYIDTSLAKTLEDVIEREAGWDELLPDSESVRGMVQGRIDDRRDEVKERISERREEMKVRIVERREEVKEQISERRDELGELLQPGHMALVKSEEPAESSEIAEIEQEAESEGEI